MGMITNALSRILLNSTCLFQNNRYKKAIKQLY